MTPKSNPALTAAITIQPTCVSVNAGDSQFMFYKGGILNTTTCGTGIFNDSRYFDVFIEYAKAKGPGKTLRLKVARGAGEADLEIILGSPPER